MLKKLFLASSIALFSFPTLAEVSDKIDFPEPIKTFNINGRNVTVYSGSSGKACPRLYVIVDDGFETDSFGTCSESLQLLKKVDDSIILTMNGFQGPFEPEKEQIKASKEVWQFIYQNGKITEKRIR